MLVILFATTLTYRHVTSWRWIFENIGTGAPTYSGSNITTHHNFGKPGIYNVTLNTWGPDGNDTLLKSGYITAMAISTETTTKNKTTESVSTNAKAKNETTESVNIPMNPNWGSKDQQHYLNGYNEGFRCKKSGFFAKSEKTFTIRKVNHFHPKENDT